MDELDKWADEFEAFHARFAPHFKRREPREQAPKYVRGLLGSMERKNSWQLAEAVGDEDPQLMQRLLFSAQWDEDGARDELQQFVVERFGDEEAIGIVDETGFLKKGTKSAGVKRQYSGTAGKIANCQVGVFLSYASPGGYTFLDRRLFLPEEWCEDPQRCQETKIPEPVEHKTKARLGLDMLAHAWENGVPMRWVTADEAYGDAQYFRAGVAQAGKRFVVAVSSTCPVWSKRPRVEPPKRRTGGRPRTKGRVAEGEPTWQPVRSVAANWSKSRWRRLGVQQGEKGTIVYDWARQRVVERRDGLPGDDVWLLARRSVTDPTEIAYYLSNAPAKTTLKQLAGVASSRFLIEQTIQQAKGEVGLDEYEVRYWHSWHRHVTLSMMAHAWLAAMRQTSGEKTARPRCGRADRTRGAEAAGSGAASAEPIARRALGLVAMATQEASAGAPQSLPSRRAAVA